MIVRKMEEKDLEAVSAICLASFFQSVADTLSDESYKKKRSIEWSIFTY